MRNLELLAPAKNPSIGIKAFNYGADAVYIGAPKFGARKAASNELSDIEELVKYADKFNAKVYATLNTILYDDELKETESLIHSLYNIGVTGIIIQDLGILEMNLPPIELHASTQANNFELERIKFLDKTGFKRIVLARELNLDQIKEIRENVETELEYFIHGALCVSLSGQCYFSAFNSDRSGNRGDCAQHCRMKYSLYDSENKIIAKDKYLLSLKDLNNSNYLEKLVQAGISSFKIEGRLKDEDYVINTVAHYNKLINAFIESNKGSFKRSSSGSCDMSFVPNPSASFNRGFSNYFLNGRKKNITSFNTPKSLGEYLGKVVKASKKGIIIKTEKNISNGDGLCYFDSNGTLVGFKADKVEEGKILTSKNLSIKKGTGIFRNYNKAFTEKLIKDNSQRQIPVDISILATKERFTVEITDEDSIKSRFEVSKSLQEADNKDKLKETIIKQFSKLGNTVFSLRKIYCDEGFIPFLTVSELNGIKRDAIENHIKMRISTLKRVDSKKIKIVNYYKKEITYKENVSNRLAEQFYRKRGVSSIESAFEISKPENAELMVTKHCLKYELNMCTKYGGKKDSDIKEPLFLEDNINRYPLEFDCKKCMMIVKAPKKSSLRSFS